ncbi:MAG TPA: hypothetical protein DCZ72_11180 [Armatimonadetes bacterium]|nr:hypothetical protein [Armatimonadota bacterium]
MSEDSTASADLDNASMGYVIWLLMPEIAGLVAWWRFGFLAAIAATVVAHVVRYFVGCPAWLMPRQGRQREAVMDDYGLEADDVVWERDRLEAFQALDAELQADHEEHITA